MAEAIVVQACSCPGLVRSQYSGFVVIAVIVILMLTGTGSK